jgi:hypothetical protein
MLSIIDFCFVVFMGNDEGGRIPEKCAKAPLGCRGKISQTKVFVRQTKVWGGGCRYHACRLLPGFDTVPDG